MNILIMGAGALGSVFGGFLAQAGHQVHLVGRSGHMAAIRERGLSIGGIWGEHRVRDLQTHTAVAQLSGQPFDLILITTKAYDTTDAVNEVSSLVRPDTLVASLQNGLGNLGAIAAAVGWERTLGARVIFGADLVQEGRVEVTVWGGEVMLGSPEGTVPQERIARIAQAFTEAGIASAATDQIEAYIWGKLLYNCCLNPLSALLEVPYGALLQAEETRQIMSQIIEEAFAVADRRDVKLLWERPQEYRRLLFEELIPATAAHYASMYADLKRGKRTEIEAMNGAIVRLGKQGGVPTPANELVTGLVLAKEKVSRAK